MWTKADIIELLKTNNHAVERAIVAIYNNQTQDEKDAKETRHHNNIGFRSNHAHKCSWFAKRILWTWRHHGRNRLALTPEQMPYARKAMLQYTRQLLQIANKKPTV